MRIVIHQPYFLPWLGFFAKIVHADGYVALDNVHFRKRHFHDRTRIVSMHGTEAWLGVPTGQNFGKLLNQIILEPAGFVPRLLQTIEYSYVRGRHFKELWPGLVEAFSTLPNNVNLADMNLHLIEWMLQTILCGVTRRIWRSSALTLEDLSATDRVIEICERTGADAIVVGMGASLSPEVHDWERITGSGINVFLQNFDVAGLKYFQARRQYAGFCPGVSAIDTLLNIGGQETLALLSSGGLTPSAVREFV